MVISSCSHPQTKKNGKDKLGNPRVRCCLCGKSWIVPAPRALGNLRTPKDKAVMVIRMMLEGASLRTIHRLTGVNRKAIAKILLLIGKRCQKFLDKRIANVQTGDIQVDELWAFIGAKEKMARALRKDDEFGDCYTFLAIDRDSKLVLSHQVGKRALGHTYQFASKLRDAIAGDCHVTSDGFRPYESAIPTALWDKQVSYAQLIKIFGRKTPREEARYSPAPIVGLQKRRMWGDCRHDQICTSHVERLNLSLRMGLRRFTRLTNAFSKSWKYHEAAIGLWLAFYNFCRVHQTLKTTPAVKAGVASEVWTVDRLLDEIAADTF
jgi:IS1 family transposase/transposase-like protein